MILRPRSQEMFKPYQNTLHDVQNSQMRKKVQNFSFLPTQKIGKGYSSTVYKGENDLTNHPVAIKVIELKSLRDQNTKRFLQNQLQCLRKLNHLNCLKYINSFMTTNNCYIITELYEAGDLSKILKKVGHFEQHKVYEIFLQFFQGYCHFHSKGFIHRDIKPSNILVSTKGEYCIADFGFVKKLTQHPKDSFNVGTPVYMSPQSITSNIYTQKSDIWSMGIMLFQLAYGYLPFHSRNQNDLKRDICNKELKLNLVEEYTNIYMSSEFKLLLTNCLRKNPENRINLWEIKEHVWMRKLGKNVINENKQNYDLLNHQSNHHHIINHSMNIVNTQPEIHNNHIGYIGDQPIKRQRSLQGGHGFSLQNYYKNPQKKLTVKPKSTLKQQYSSIQKDKQNISLNVNLIKEKFKALDQLVDHNQQKFNLLGKIDTKNNFIVNHNNNKVNIINSFTEPLTEKSFNNVVQSNKQYLNKLLQNKLNVNANANVNVNANIESPGSYQNKFQKSQKINNNDIDQFLDKKQHHNNSDIFIRSQDPNLLKTKSDQISLLNNTQRQRQNNSLHHIIESSPCLQNNRSSLIQGMRNIISLKNDHINRFKQLSKKKYCLDINMKAGQDVKLLKLSSQTNKQNNSFTKNSSLLSTNKLNINNFQSLQLSSSLTKIDSISNHEFLIRTIHLLRFLHEVISIKITQDIDYLQEIFQAKQKIYQYFAILLNKLTRIISFKKENCFRLQKWTQFVKEQKFKTLQEGVRKYRQKFTTNAHILQHLNHIDNHTENQFYSIRSHNIIGGMIFKLLKRVQILTQSSKQTRNSPSVSNNPMIRVLFYYYKSLQIISCIIEKDEKNFIVKNNPAELVQQITAKTKDPFKIPKMIIQLKKKLMIIQAHKEHQKNQVILAKLVCQ